MRGARSGRGGAARAREGFLSGGAPLQQHVRRNAKRAAETVGEAGNAAAFPHQLESIKMICVIGCTAPSIPPPVPGVGEANANMQQHKPSLVLGPDLSSAPGLGPGEGSQSRFSRCQRAIPSQVAAQETPSEQPEFQLAYLPAQPGAFPWPALADPLREPFLIQLAVGGGGARGCVLAWAHDHGLATRCRVCMRAVSALVECVMGVLMPYR